MPRNVLTAVLFIASIISIAPLTAKAQAAGDRQTRTTSAAGVADALARLPPSEAVMYVDMQRVLNDALGRAFTNSPAGLARVNSDIDAFKTRTGIDARQFDTLAISLKFTPRLKSLFPPQGTLQINPVVIARGRFDADAIFRTSQQAAQSTASVTREREQRYKGKTIYSVRLEPGIKLFGLIDLREPEIAIAVLDANTLAIGKPSTVRTAIDADAGGKRVDVELVQLAARQANTVMGFAGTVPGIVARRIDLGSDELSRPFRAVRGFYGSLLTTATGFEFLTNLRTTDQAAAGELSKTLMAMRDFIPGLLTQLPAAIGKAAATNARNIRINAQDAEVAIRVELVPPGTVALVR